MWLRPASCGAGPRRPTMRVRRRCCAALAGCIVVLRGAHCPATARVPIALQPRVCLVPSWRAASAMPAHNLGDTAYMPRTFNGCSIVCRRRVPHPRHLPGLPAAAHPGGKRVLHGAAGGHRLWWGLRVVVVWSNCPAVLVECMLHPCMAFMNRGAGGHRLGWGPRVVDGCCPVLPCCAC